MTDRNVTLRVLPGPALAELVADKVRARFGELNGELEALVVQAVDRELDGLVARPVAERLAAGDDSDVDASAQEPAGPGENNVEAVAAPSAEHPSADVAAAAPPTKVCVRCDEEKPLDEERAAGRLESDGDGRVRPTPRFPAGIVEALADLGESR
jgi:hypothetical protein